MDLPKAESDGASPRICVTGKTGCPNTKPFGAQTLVGLATCIDSTDGTAPGQATKAPCTPKVEVCPLVNPSGNQPFRYLVARPNDTCSTVVDILLQASGDGGAGLEWRVQDYAPVEGKCVTSGPQRVGLSSMPGSCCSTSLEIPVPERNRIFRLTARTDWLVP